MEIKKTYLPISFVSDELRNQINGELWRTTEIQDTKQKLIEVVSEGLRVGIVPCGELKAIFFDKLTIERVKDLEKAVHDTVALIKEHNMKSDIEILLESEQAGGKYASLFEKFDPRELR